MRCGSRPAGWGLWRGEVAVLVLLAAWALAPLVYLLAIAHGDRFDGADGIFGSTDTLQYLAWIRESGQHLLVSNHFDTAASPRVFLHPMFAISGLLWDAGLSLQVAYLAWLPIAVVAMFATFRAYASRHLAGRADRLMALLLGLFWFSPLTPLVDWGHLTSEVTRNYFIILSLETFQAGALWSALPTALTFALLPAVFLLAERALDSDGGAGRGRVVAAACAAGLTASLLHPWQGITILLTLGALWVWDGLKRRNLVLLPILAATAVPVAYYAVLPQLSLAWAIAGAPSRAPHLGVWLLFIAPLALPALAGFAGPARDPGERILRLWPVMAVVLYALLNRSFIYHALESLTLPLAVLAVRGMRRLAGPAPAWAAVALLCIPGVLYVAVYLPRTATDRTQYFVTADEARALDHLAAAPGFGGVLAPQYIGKDVPFRTGRSTWLGHPTWTPDFAGRLRRADAFFNGVMPDSATRSFVGGANVDYILSGCQPSALPGWVRASPATTFGCATVYDVRR